MSRILYTVASFKIDRQGKQAQSINASHVMRVCVLPARDSIREEVELTRVGRLRAMIDVRCEWIRLAPSDGLLLPAD